MKLQCMRSLLLAALLLLVATTGFAQFKVQTFGKFQKVKAAQDIPTDFKTTFPLKAQVYVQLSYPAEPAFYTIDCYKVQDDGQEKLVGTTDIKSFEKKSNKVLTSWGILGMMYEPGRYKVKAMKQSDKSIVAESEFTVTEESAVAERTVATVIFCDDTDDNFNPIKPVTSIRAGESVNFLAKLKEGIGARFFIWAVFEITGNDETLYKDMQQDVDNETNRWFATVEKTTFSKPGKYAVYMLYQNATNSGMSVHKPTKYYARGVLDVK